MGEAKRRQEAMASHLCDLTNAAINLLNMKSERGREHYLRRLYDALPEHRKSEVEIPPEDES